jgi:hypothetical protein
MLLVSLTADRPLPACLYSSLDALGSGTRPAPPFAISPYSSKRTEKQIAARTMGLLEVHAAIGFCNQLVREVHFFHRTVADFIRQKDVHDTLVRLAGPTFDPNLAICRAIVSAIDGCLRAPMDKHYKHTILWALVHEKVRLFVDALYDPLLKLRYRTYCTCSSATLNYATRKAPPLY